MCPSEAVLVYLAEIKAQLKVSKAAPQQKSASISHGLLPVRRHFRQINLDPAIIKETLIKSTFALSLDQELLIMMEDEARWMIKNRLTGQTRVPNYLSYMDATALSHVVPRAVTMIIPQNWQ